MKFLSVLALVQTVLVLLLLIKIDSFEDRVDELTASAGQQSDTKPIAILPPQDEAVAVQAVQDGLDGQQLRRILREELRQIASSDELLVQTAAPDLKTPVYDEVEMQYQQDLVLDELEFLKGQDEVLAGELDELIGKIAGLDPERRTEMFRMLTQAMNRGEIKGQL